jgi:hypothetical protein
VIIPGTARQVLSAWRGAFANPAGGGCPGE